MMLNDVVAPVAKACAFQSVSLPMYPIHKQKQNHTETMPEPKLYPNPSQTVSKPKTKPKTQNNAKSQVNASSNQMTCPDEL